MIQGDLRFSGFVLFFSPPTTMAAPDLNGIHDFLVSLAFRAGDIITNALPDTSGTGSKKNSVFGRRRQ